MKQRITVFLGAALLALAVSAYAHHPFAAEYDWKKPVTLTGTVTKIEWTNPHAYIYMDGNDQNGQMQHWKLEMGSPGALTRAGWNRNMVKMGDQITIDGWLSKTKNDQANVKSVKLSDGHELSAASSIGETPTTEKKTISN